MTTREEVLKQLEEAGVTVRMDVMRTKIEEGNPREIRTRAKLLVHMVANALCAKCKQPLDYGNNVTLTVADGTIHRVCPTGG